uniref:Uncharacterized protein n=1 Tax=Zygnema circumcarinatum TaxID=35869 RepID=Q32RI8_ZYGCR|nr:hypothetical protein P8547_pgp032 [Zygnema circumcarinatum]AAX45891.1 hypothetical protein [Zygnema circumcarinatum]
MAKSSFESSSSSSEEPTNPKKTLLVGYVGPPAKLIVTIKNEKPITGPVSITVPSVNFNAPAFDLSEIYARLDMIESSMIKKNTCQN